jgi:ketoreductase RED1
LRERLGSRRAAGGGDDVVTNSIGLRWATQGPFLSFDLGGGDAGLGAFVKHLGPHLEATWKILGNPTLDDATVELLVEQAARLFGTDHAALDADRDRDRAQLATLHTLASVRGNGP